jgi:hypothetical protein
MACLLGLCDPSNPGNHLGRGHVGRFVYNDDPVHGEKSQITSTKFQINLKFQYPMNKTNPELLAQGRIEFPVLHVRYFDFSSIDAKIFFNSFASWMRL